MKYKQKKQSAGWGLKNPHCTPLIPSIIDNSCAKHFWDISLDAEALQLL